MLADLYTIFEVEKFDCCTFSRAAAF